MSNLGFNSSSNGNHVSIICQICFILGHGAHKCKNRFNPAFVPQKYYNRGGRRGPRPIYSVGRGFVSCGVGRGFVPMLFICFNGQNDIRGYGFQGNVTYANPKFVLAPYLFFLFYASSLALTSATTFSCYSSTLDNLTRLVNSFAVVLPSTEAIKDLSWYTDSGASAHVTNNSGILLNLQYYKGSKLLLVGDGNGL